MHVIVCNDIISLSKVKSFLLPDPMRGLIDHQSIKQCSDQLAYDVKHVQADAKQLNKHVDELEIG